MSEKQFQSQVVSLARQLVWLCYHTYDSRRCEPGFPDLVLVRDRVMFRELKTDKGKLTLAQKALGVRLEKAGSDWATWRPSDLQQILRELSR